jgi:hypothetical protein
MDYCLTLNSEKDYLRHLCFLDDLIAFTEASTQVIQALKGILDQFITCLG